MKRSELQYNLPLELIAQRPADPRDAARLLVLHRATGKLEHRAFRELHSFLRHDDCLVRNDTRVLPARFDCRRETGGRIEALFLREDSPEWRVLLKPSARLKVGQRLAVENDDALLVIRAPHQRGEWSVRPDPPQAPHELLARVGRTPLPPYIHRDPRPDAADRARYQTVYAKTPGAVAAPTAGLHFTPELIRRIESAGVHITDVTLHVGLGTFAPLTVDDLADHRMHSEWYEINELAANRIGQTRAGAGRIIAVGTTSARVLESLPVRGCSAASGWTDIFIYPPYACRNVDALLTNFHLPHSTLLALVMAFAGVEQTRTAYRAAIAERYRFYSYGDAMLIL